MGKALGGMKPAAGSKAEAVCQQVGDLSRRRVRRLILAVVAVFLFAHLLRLNLQIYGNSYSLYVNTYEPEASKENSDSKEVKASNGDVKDADEPNAPVPKKTKEAVKPTARVKEKLPKKIAKTRPAPVKLTPAKPPDQAKARPKMSPPRTTPSPQPKVKVKPVGKMKTSDDKPTTSDVKPTTAEVNNKTKKCPLVSPKLVGIVKPDLYPPTLEVQETLHPELRPGGHYTPTDCTSYHQVAIIIPYRDREEHLTILMNHLHPILQRQQIDYSFFVVEQAGVGMFNRGMLKNIGVLEAIRRRRYTCIIFHDVDLLPENDMNPYTCFSQPHHLSVGVDTMKYKLLYDDLFGGVASVEVVPFLRANGFSNKYWGWGAEDDDLAWRLQNGGFFIRRFSPILSRYTMLRHAKDKPSPTRYKYLNTVKKRYMKDGLNSIRYRVLDVQKRPLYTWLYVDLFPS
ncbi:beta-1,4-galactosyltransferase 4-like [Eriocheir sinensis]|uniref:beta-1,4-galactosyltransferase 4-like n=1 Tax=Eriocheir sinensis TaxID=95602 RepID=UPI0021C786C4|nr:beta-1,4-galactosyltransferase 4-like [Eriocheir sinensis]